MNASSCSLVFSLLLSTAALAQPGEPARSELHLAPGSRLWIDGDSNVCSFKVEARALQLTLAADSTDLRGLRAVVPVQQLSSGNGILDDNLRHALRAQENPVISLDISTLHAQGSDGRDGFTAQADGELTMAGVTRPLTFTVKVVREGKALHLVGELPLRMSDFRVQPPVVMGGFIKVHDGVRVHLDVRVDADASRLASSR